MMKKEENIELEIQELKDQIQEEMNYYKKLQMKFLKDKTNWFKFGKGLKPYWLYLGGKIEKSKDDNDILYHRYLKDNRHFLRDPVVQELEQTKSSIGHKQTLIDALRGKLRFDIVDHGLEEEDEYEN